MRQKILLLCFVLLSCLTTAFAAPITGKRIAPEGTGLPRGTLFITTAGRERSVAKQVWKAWIIEAGRAIVYAGSDGAGGFENEGQSLWRYDAQSGQRRKLMSEYFMIENVREARSRAGRLALVVSMRDGGLGAPHMAIVHPQRGEVWRQTVARLSGIRNGRIAIAVLRTDEITDSPEEYRTRRMLYLNLDKLLSRRVIRLVKMA